MAEATEPYKVYFHWKNDSSGKLKAVSCDEKNIPGEEGFLANVSHIVESFKGGEQAACLTVNETNTLHLKKGGFLYMDVGCWLGGKQTFGLICGEDAAVCGFKYPSQKPAPKPVASSSRKSLLDRFAELPNISIHLREKVQSPGSDPDHLYLILPDMHVPDAPPLGYSRPVNDGRWNATNGGAWDIDPRAFDVQTKRDFFNSRASIPAMIDFLSVVAFLAEKPAWKDKITLVQLGDMYELWAGRDLEFIPNEPPKEPKVELVPGGSQEVSRWISETHQRFPLLFQAFDECAKQGIAMLFLHGNHDNYLSCPKVVQEANACIKSDIILKSDPPTTVYKRHKEINQDHIFIEHGQRCDPYNRDGATEGFENCNSAVDPHGVKYALSLVVNLKDLGATERAMFVVGAAAKWCVKERNFGVYVMGHTHTPDLKRVEVYHQREGTVYVVGGGTMAEVTTETPLEGTE